MEKNECRLPDIVHRHRNRYEQEQVVRAYEPFYTTKDRTQGTGLDLSMVMGIVKQAGGKISLTSREGHGTTVELICPLATDKNQPPQMTSLLGTEFAPGGGQRICVIEDRELLSTALSTMLMQNGYVVTTFNEGNEAWAHIEASTENIDLVVTDVLLPGMKGDVLVELIRSLNPDLPFIFISAFSDGLEQIQNDEQTRTLAKPFEQTTLLRMIDKLLKFENV